MSNLVPEKRVNKNGVAVTKHVRASAVPVSTAPLPAPSLSTGTPTTAPTARDLRERLLARLAELSPGAEQRISTFGYELPYIDEFPESVRQDVYDFLETANDNDCHEVEQLFRLDYENPNLFSAFVNTIRDVRWIETCRDEHGAKRSADNFRKTFDKVGLRKAKNGLSQYHFDVVKAEHIAAILQLSEDDFVTPHEYYGEIEVIRKSIDTILPMLPVVFAVAIAREDAYIGRYMNGNSPKSKMSYKPMSSTQIIEIAEYAQQYPDRTEMIASTIKERGEFDTELIDTMIAGGATAVASGVL